jgi:hypothetical protein
MVTFTINIPPMLVYIPYMDPMGMIFQPMFDYQRVTISAVRSSVWKPSPAKVRRQTAVTGYDLAGLPHIAMENPQFSVAHLQTGHFPYVRF